MRVCQDFQKYYMESAEKKGDFRYRIMLIVHSLEKGMCFSDPRPFGTEKVKDLIRKLKLCSDRYVSSFEYRLGINILYAWCDFYDEHKWENEPMYKETRAFLSDKPKFDGIVAGRKKYTPNRFESSLFEDVVLSRHSVRDFQNKKLSDEDINFAVKCFIETPTACNRQMCHIYCISNPEIKSLLNQVLIGIHGFNKQNVQFFIITYDLAAFAYSGERQQGLFNAGLCTMNFVNGLHAKGIGSCCLQWSNKNNEDLIVRHKIGLLDSERIAIVIGAGYYLKENIIPCSSRRNPTDVYSII